MCHQVPFLLYQLQRTLGDLQGIGLDVCGKSRPHPPGFDLRTLQSVPSRHTDYAIPPKSLYLLLLSLLCHALIGHKYILTTIFRNAILIVSKFLSFATTRKLRSPPPSIPFQVTMQLFFLNMFFFGMLNTLFMPRILLNGLASGHVAERSGYSAGRLKCCLCDTARPGVVVPTLRMRNTAVSYGCMAIKPTGNKEMLIFVPALRHSLWTSRCVLPVVFSKELGVVILTAEHNYICLYYCKENIITTCSGPICVPSSGCDLDFWISYTGMRGAFLGSLGGGG